MKNRVSVFAVVILAITSMAVRAADQPPFKAKSPTETPEQRAERMKWFRDARFGMFIHWGPYAVLGGEYKGKNVGWISEWIQHSGRIPYKEYEQIAATFNPVRFDAKQFVKTAKDAGMKYMVITSKHHDGFCMWNTRLTDYSIVKWTPFKRDVIKELAEECKRQGLKFGIYYSIRDWHHPDMTFRYVDLEKPRQYNSRWGFPPSPWTKGGYYGCGCPTCGQNISPVSKEFDPRPTEAEGADMNRYLDYVKGQLIEILTKYKSVGLMWFDGQDITDNKLARVDEMIDTMRQINPKVIISDRIANSGDAADFGIHENYVPGGGTREWETCTSMNGSWGYSKFDKGWKPVQSLVRTLVDTTSKNGNFLLNVGPDGEGLIPEDAMQRLQEVGQWLAANGTSIYGCGAAVVSAPKWSRVTAKEGKFYFHIFDWPKDGQLNVERFKGTVKRAYMLADKKKTALKVTHTVETLTVSLPPEAPDRIDSVVCVETE